LTVSCFYHTNCGRHNPGLGHPERPERYHAVLTSLRTLADKGVAVLTEATPATREALGRVHPRAYVQRLEALNEKGGGMLDADTFMTEHTWDAALAAAGAAIAAVDAGIQAGTAFGATRPPGHHALADQAMGFCLLNNVVIGARHAQVTHRIDRVLIIDWDVHHGNGTQALVERDPSIRYVSMHQYPWYPGTGAAEERGVGNVFNVPRPPGLPRRQYVADLLDAVRAALDGWSPGLILVSAGFDSLHGDPLGGFTLLPEDMAAWTAEFRALGKGTPVVGVLEGGYRLELLAAGVSAHVGALA
jgi:acetoin utilization deacetylase AcuC-like enzyme